MCNNTCTHTHTALVTSIPTDVISVYTTKHIPLWGPARPEARVFLKGRQALKGITIKKLMMHKVPQITSRAFHRRLRRQQSTHTHTAVARKPLPLMYTTGASVAFRLVSGTYSGGRRVISARVCVCQGRTCGGERGKKRDRALLSNRRFIYNWLVSATSRTRGREK